MIRTIFVESGHVLILDQNRLPARVEYVKIDDHMAMARAIRGLQVRGAPLIGVAAAFGLALATLNYRGKAEDFIPYYRQAEQLLSSTRPTAVNLFWALARMRQVLATSDLADITRLGVLMMHTAEAMCAEDIRVNRALGDWGQQLLPDQARVLTHCNAGALATCGFGTALGIVRSAHEKGQLSRVWACETRPVLQGSRLTVWELIQDEIPVTLITDSMAGAVMKDQGVDAVIVGADRVAANGDTANKIGTYSLAVLAAYHRIPFYVAAPLSSIDLAIGAGPDIPIEQRDPMEIRQMAGQYITLPQADVFNPAFDVTPADLINAIITEIGVVRAPYTSQLAAIRRERKEDEI